MKFFGPSKKANPPINSTLAHVKDNANFPGTIMTVGKNVSELKQKQPKYKDASLEFSNRTAGTTPSTPPGLSWGFKGVRVE